MAAQLAGARVMMPFESGTTKQPLNVNDEDLHPDMTELPAERQGATDMIFCLTRAELAKCWQKTDLFQTDFGRAWETGDLDVIKRAEADIDAAENDVERKFLRYCDFIEPTQCLTIAVARTALTRARLRLRLPRMMLGLPMTTAEQTDMSKMAMKILDWDISVHTNPALAKYLWHMQAYFQYEPLIWIVIELRKGSPAIVNQEEAWHKIEQVFACHPEFINTRRALHVAVAKLTIQAWEARPTSVSRPVEDNALITNLRSCFITKNVVGTDGIATFKYNPWATQDYSSILAGSTLTGSSEVVTPMDFSVDNIDWTFWDELIRAPGSLPEDGGDLFKSQLPS